MLLSVAFLLAWGLNLGVEFTGGSLLELKFIRERPAVSEVHSALKTLELGDVQIQPQGEKGLVIRTSTLTEQQHRQVLETLKDKLPPFQEQSFQAIGPIIGEELKKNSAVALLIGLIGIALYIGLVFRRARLLVKPWQYSAVVLVTLLHDVLITIGVFSVLGHFLNIQIGVPFVAAVLTVLGYSVNDTIVVFNRIRERVLSAKKIVNLSEEVEQALRDTLRRSLNTSLSTLVVVLAVLFWGGAGLFNFALALAIGISIGTYSSLLIAPPLLLLINQRAR